MDYNNNVGIDLHIHSTASDGTLTPFEILNIAQKLNLGAISITDHDTIDGSKEALRIGMPSPLRFLTGVEISVSSPQPLLYSESIHILGYSINLDDPILNHTLEVLQEARKNRNPQILERLNNLGIDITFNDILKEAGDGQVGRPHIAQSMVNKGFVKSIDEAFNNYLGKGKPAYVDKFRVDCSKAIKIILDSGGFPVLAHPILLKTKNDNILENLVVTLKTMGLKGIEVYYPQHSPDNVAYYTKLAKRYGLLMTGGTDFHGSLKPDIKIGLGNGDFFVPYELYEKLVKRWKK